VSIRPSSLFAWFNSRLLNGEFKRMADVDRKHLPGRMGINLRAAIYPEPKPTARDRTETYDDAKSSAKHSLASERSRRSFTNISERRSGATNWSHFRR
jgi:hypothetical protein